MSEIGDRWQGPAAGATSPEDAASVEQRSGVSRAMAGAVVVLALLVPGAFVAGWRLRRSYARFQGGF